MTAAPVLVLAGGYDGREDIDSVEIHAPPRSLDKEEECLALDSDWMLAKGEMPTVRSAAGVAAVDGRVYYAGGSTGDVAHNVVESFRVKRDRKIDGFRCDWQSEPSLSVPRMALSLVATTCEEKENNRKSILWAVGGFNNQRSVDTVETMEIDPCSGASSCEWRPGPPLLEARCSFGALATEDGGAIVVVGGHGGCNNGVLGSCELLDPRIGGWQSLPPMRHKRSCLAAASLPGNRLVACGGHDGRRALATVEIFDLRGGKWDDNAEDMPTARSGLAAASIGDKAYAMGGYPDGTAVGSDARALRCAEMWNDNTQKWSTVSPTRCGRTGPGAVPVFIS